MDCKTQIRLSASLMFIAVALGAMGAHLLKVRLGETGHLEEWKTAVLYHLIHALAMLVMAVAGRRDRASFSFWAWLVGILLFSGSLYVMSMTGSKALPIVLATPLGGIAFLIGWLSLAIQPSQANPSSGPKK
jgi:uncharacterized membrane protein YgdD (TMEM256/DUF423 family)